MNGHRDLSILTLCCVLFGTAVVGTAAAAPVILNEFNAVSSGNYLDGGDYSDNLERGDPYFATYEGVTNGRIQGNGGNWIELVVTEDHVDMRGWELRWVERGTTTGTSNIWTGNPAQEQGIITLGNVDIWSNLRSGTIVTISERNEIPVDTTLRLGEKNFTDTTEADGTFEATINLSTNTSYDPAAGDWWIHVSTLDELDATPPLVQTITNVQGDSPGNFTVGNDDWQLTILDAADVNVYGPVGEGVSNFTGINNEEVGKLEANPSTSVTPASNYNDGTSSTFGAPNSWSNGTVTQDFTALRSVITTQPQLQAGDANMDLKFDQLDLVKVQVAAKYLTGRAATWGDGDWNGAPGGSVGNPPQGDGLFNQLDIIEAQLANLYLKGPYAAIAGGGQLNDGQTSLVYNAQTGEVSVDAPAGTQLTSINIESASGIFTGSPAQNLGGSFDNDTDTNIFKATFGSSFGSLSFGNVAQPGLSEQLMQGDLTVVGSLAGGGDLGAVDLVYIPEPTAVVLLGLGLLGVLPSLRGRRRR